jgi:surface polysaccharide O-acyltransferase-like enzyme
MYGSYLLSRGVRILAPYWVYALVSGAIVVAMRHLPVGETLRFWLDPNWTGAGHSWLFLNKHLWFVSPFLGVTALLPLFARVPAWEKAPLWTWAIVGTLIIFAIDALRMPSLRLVEMVVFYGLWALFGFGLAAAPRRFGAHDFWVLLALALAALAAAYMVFRGHTDIDMQRNKFPPNAMFFLFSCAWMSVFMLIVKAMDPEWIEALANFSPLKPFIRSGYSLYLWQGVGYSAAAWGGYRLGLSDWEIWPIAIVLTVIFGMLFAPVERIRLKRSASTPRRA